MLTPFGKLILIAFLETMHHTVNHFGVNCEKKVRRRGGNGQKIKFGKPNNNLTNFNISKVRYIVAPLPKSVNLQI